MFLSLEQLGKDLVQMVHQQSFGPRDGRGLVMRSRRLDAKEPEQVEALRANAARRKAADCMHAGSLQPDVADLTPSDPALAPCDIERQDRSDANSAAERHDRAERQLLNEDLPTWSGARHDRI